MESKRLRELWSTTGKHGAVINRIYALSDNPLFVCSPEDNSPRMCVFSVVNTNGKEIGFLFDNIIQDGIQLREKLENLIIANGVFHNTSALRQSVLKWVYAAYKRAAIDAAEVDNARMIIDDPCLWFDTVPIYDLRRENLKSDTAVADAWSNAFLLRGNCDMAVNVKGVLFWTEYDPSLYASLRSVQRWKLNKGREEDQRKGEAALVAVLKSGVKYIHISFAEIVWQFHQGLIDMACFGDSVIKNHRDLMAAGLVVDHLTQRRTNCFSWALAAIPEQLNRALSTRDQLSAPFYFFTVWDKTIGKFRVKLGAYGLGWERRYLFDDLGYGSQPEDVFSTQVQYQYSALFDRFKGKIGDKYKDPERASYLRFWSDPERTHDKGNLLTALLEESVESYVDISENFEDEWDDLVTLFADWGDHEKSVDPSEEDDT